MTPLELLAPARNKDIGIAAIDCGADAVYIGGPAFGARKAAGNSLQDIATLCAYAHKFGARVMMTVNTLFLSADELESARSIMREAQQVGVDAFIVQDPALFATTGIQVPLHASTQCAIRDLQTARYYEALGAGRIVLERELSLSQVREIASGVSCEIEFFVHGALCVCYSGQCYLSEAITGRSANRGECAQPCRTRYDLVDGSGKVLVHDKALLSLKDLRLADRLEQLADAGVCSFKIEGRLKNMSYVRNVVREYSLALDALVAAHPDKYCRASAGRVTEGFAPAVDKTFNRGYTQLYIDGRRGQWSCMDAPKAMGEDVGKVVSVSRHSGIMDVRVEARSAQIHFTNGDGFSFVNRDGGISGFRGDICNGLTIRAKDVPSLRTGDTLFRNLDTAFERALDATACRREIDVQIEVHISGHYTVSLRAVSADGRKSRLEVQTDAEAAKDAVRMRDSLSAALCKRHLHYRVTDARIVIETAEGSLPFMPASELNALRRELISRLDAIEVIVPAMRLGDRTAQGDTASEPFAGTRNGSELMRTRYCIKFELGLCSKLQGHAPTGPLYLVNNGRRFPLGFDCSRCEMTVLGADVQNT